jgi:hypothetical protein
MQAVSWMFPSSWHGLAALGTTQVSRARNSLAPAAE